METLTYLNAGALFGADFYLTNFKKAAGDVELVFEQDHTVTCKRSYWKERKLSLERVTKSIAMVVTENIITIQQFASYEKLNISGKQITHHQAVKKVCDFYKSNPETAP